MQQSMIKRILWVLASIVLVGSTIGGVASALSSSTRPAPAVNSSVPLYGSNSQ